MSTRKGMGFLLAAPLAIAGLACALMWWSSRRLPELSSSSADESRVSSDASFDSVVVPPSYPTRPEPETDADEPYDPLVGFVPDEGLPEPGPPVRVFGIVSGSEGAPPRSPILVQLAHELGRRAGCFTDAEGAYECLAPFPGEWTLSVYPVRGNHRDFEETVRFAEGESERRIDIRLEGDEPLPDVDVYLETSAGVPLLVAMEGERMHLSIRLLVSEAEPGERIPRMGLTTSSRYADDGTASEDRRLVNYIGIPRDRWLEGLYRRFEVLEPVPLWVSAVLGDRVLSRARADVGSDRVTLVVDPSTIRAMQASYRYRLVDSLTGEPIVAEERGDDPLPDGSRRVEARPGRKTLRVNIAGYEPRERVFELQPGEHLDLGDWALDPEVRIAGSFVDPSGRGAWTQFALVNLDRFDPAASLERKSIFNVPSGEFEARGVGRGRYAIFPVSERFAREPTIVDTTAGSVEGLRIDLVPATKVTLVSEVPELEAPLVHILTSDGVPLLSRFFARSSAPIELCLGPGTYRLVRVEEGRTATESFTVGAEPSTVRVGGS